MKCRIYLTYFMILSGIIRLVVTTNVVNYSHSVSNQLISSKTIYKDVILLPVIFILDQLSYSTIVLLLICQANQSQVKVTMMLYEVRFIFLTKSS